MIDLLKITDKCGVQQVYSTAAIEKDLYIEEKIKTLLRSLIPTAGPLLLYTPRHLTPILLEAWTEHIDLCNKADAFLLHSAGNMHEDHILNECIGLYKVLVESDRRKRALSISIKTSIDHALNRTGLRLSAEEELLARIPSHPPFWPCYVNDHRDKRDDVTLRYHRGSKILQEYRQTVDPLLHVESRLPAEMRKDKQKLLQTSTRYKILEAIDDLLIIDNYCEPLWIKTLVGMPDYYLRTRLCEALGVENAFDHVKIEEVMKKRNDLLASATSSHVSA